MTRATPSLRVIQSLSEVTASQWNALLPADAGPFLRYEFLHTLESTACVGDGTGWQIAHLLIEDTFGKLLAAMPLYLKSHSYGEFVFDWAWAQAYEQHGLPYYPKALCAIPFTPVRGPRLLVGSSADSHELQTMLVAALKSLVKQNHLSSAHILFPEKSELEVISQHGFLLRDAVQFHWRNQSYENFEQFLAALTMKRRKNIRKERAELTPYDLEYRHISGSEAAPSDWEFFYRCYANTYIEHRSTPYLNASFFKKLGSLLPECLHLIIAKRDTQPIAASLLFVDASTSTAYGRYWGAVEHIPFLHFELAYYQAIEYCIHNGIQTFEGGAQGEHKMARGFLPTTIQSAHWIADAEFSNAVKRFLDREHEGMTAYVSELEERSPLKSTTVPL